MLKAYYLMESKTFVSLRLVVQMIDCGVTFVSFRILLGIVWFSSGGGKLFLGGFKSFSLYFSQLKKKKKEKGGEQSLSFLFFLSLKQ